MAIMLEAIGVVRSSRSEVIDDGWDRERAVGIFAQPWVRELGPRGDMRQPAWMDTLMRGYWD